MYDIMDCVGPEPKKLSISYLDALKYLTCLIIPAGTFLSEVNNRETIVAIETNSDTYCLQNRINRSSFHKIQRTQKSEHYVCDDNDFNMATKE